MWYFQSFIKDSPAGTDRKDIGFTENRRELTFTVKKTFCRIVAVLHGIWFPVLVNFHYKFLIKGYAMLLKGITITFITQFPDARFTEAFGYKCYIPVSQSYEI